MVENMVKDETITGGAFEYRASVHMDPYGGQDTESPREHDGNAAVLCLDHGRYDLPWEDDTKVREACERGGWRLAARWLTFALDAVVVPVWGYEHGALALTAGARVGQFADRWDSGQAGLAYMTREWARENLTVGEGESLDDVMENVLRSEVTYYDQWSRGEVYFWQSAKRLVGSDDEWEVIDSVHGFIGETDYPMSEALDACRAELADDRSDQDEIDDLMRTELGMCAG